MVVKARPIIKAQNDLFLEQIPLNPNSLGFAGLWRTGVFYAAFCGAVVFAISFLVELAREFFRKGDQEGYRALDG